jgi:hypothetical protein
LARSGYRRFELGLDQRPDVDTVDGHVHDLAVDVGIDQLDTVHHNPAQVDSAEPGARQIDRTQLRITEVHALQLEAAPILTEEVSHDRTVASLTGDPLAPSRRDAAAAIHNTRSCAWST